MVRKINKIIVHWSASPKNTTVDLIKAWHLARGYKDIGYHRVILHPDSIEEISILKWSDLVKKGRPFNDDTFLEDWEKGAHTLYQNHDSVGVCVIGSPQYALHPLQREALDWTLSILTQRFSLAPRDVYAHKDFNATECPGNEICDALGEWKRKAVRA